jgi:hypothetical protein
MSKVSMAAKKSGLLGKSITLLLMTAHVSTSNAAPIAPPAPNGPHILTQRTAYPTLDFDTLANAATNDPNRVDSITWEDYYNYNFAATEPSGGASHCHDPDEFFGQALGYPDTTQAPMMVAAGERGTWTSVASKNGLATEAEIYTDISTCAGVVLNGTTRTNYLLRNPLENGDNTSDAIKVERIFRFKPGLGVVANSGLRAYVPRVVSALHYVLVPNMAGQLVRYDANNCTATPCTVTDWDGTWIADDNGSNQGIVIIRATPSTLPAFVGIQSGGLSNANFSSIVLPQPAGGWSGFVTETEYICAYNGDVWIPTPGTLPRLCQVGLDPATAKSK